MKFHDAWLTIATKPLVEIITNEKIEKYTIRVDGGLSVHLHVFYLFLQEASKTIKRERNAEKPV